VGTWYLQLWAKNLASGNSYDQYAEISFVVTAATGGLTSVSLQASPGTAAVGTQVTLTATPTGGTSPQYEFWACTPAGSWSDIQAYSATNTCSWTPNIVGTWYLQLWAKNLASGNSYDQYAEISFVVTAATGGLTSVSLQASPGTAAVGTQVTLTATPTGGTSPQYEFWACTPAGSWSDIQAYSATNTCSWTPNIVGTWYLQLWAKNLASGNSYDQYAEISFMATATGGGLSAVSLQASPGTVPAKSQVTLTATPTGGTAVQYEFWVYNPSFGTWSITQAYSTTAVCYWTPKGKGAFYLEVWARNTGSLNTYDQCAEIPFTVTAYGVEGDALSLGDSVTGSLPDGGGTAWRQVRLDAPVAVTLTAEGAAGGFGVWLTDEQGAALAYDAHADANSSLSVTLPAGMYRVGVSSGVGASAVDYRLTLAATPR
jgi:hypothetical protein